MARGLPALACILGLFVGAAALRARKVSPDPVIPSPGNESLGYKKEEASSDVVTPSPGNESLGYKKQEASSDLVTPSPGNESLGYTKQEASSDLVTPSPGNESLGYKKEEASSDLVTPSPGNESLGYKKQEASSDRVTPSPGNESLGYHSHSEEVSSDSARPSDREKRQRNQKKEVRSDSAGQRRRRPEKSGVGRSALKRVDSLFQGGDGVHHSFRIPSIVGAGGGRLLAFAEGRVHCDGDYGDVNLVYKVSKDNGATWSELRYLAGTEDGSRDTWGNPTLVFEKPWEGGPTGGRVHLFFNHNDRDFREGKNPRVGCPDMTYTWRPVQHGDRQTYYVFSDDGGESWSPRRNWTQELLPPSHTWDAAGPGIGLQKEFEPNRGMLVMPANSRNLISTDHGMTWKSVMVTSNASQYPMSEATVAECPDGQLFRNDRPGPEAFKQHKRRWTLYLPKPDKPAAEASAPAMDLPDPKSQGSMLNYEPGLILFLNSDHEKERSWLRVHLSTDCGKTWSVKKHLYDWLPSDGPRTRGGYSSITRTGDEVAVLTEASITLETRIVNKKEVKLPRFFIDFLRFDLDWLCDGERYCRGASCAIQRVEEGRIYLEKSCAGAVADGALEVQLRRNGTLQWQGPLPDAVVQGDAVEALCPGTEPCEVGDALLLPSA